MGRVEDLGLDIEYREEVREMQQDALISEFEMVFSDDDVLRDMIENGDSGEIIDILGSVFDEYKKEMIAELEKEREALKVKKPIRTEVKKVSNNKNKKSSKISDLKSKLQVANKKIQNG